MQLRHLLPLAALIACSDAVGPFGEPYITGVITSRRPLILGVQDSGRVRLDSIPQILVTDSARLVEPCARSAYFVFSGSTPVTRRSGAPADTAALHLGQRVAVWTEGIMLTSCPPQMSATRILIEDGP